MASVGPRTLGVLCSTAEMTDRNTRPHPTKILFVTMAAGSFSGSHFLYANLALLQQVNYLHV